MPIHHDFLAETARQRRDEAERIAIRMGFHSAFVRATAAESLAAARATARPVQGPGLVVRSWRALRAATARMVRVATG